MSAEKNNKQGSPFVQPIFIATKHDTNNKGTDAYSSCVFVPFHPFASQFYHMDDVLCMCECTSLWIHSWQCVLE